LIRKEDVSDDDKNFKIDKWYQEYQKQKTKENDKKEKNN